MPAEESSEADGEWSGGCTPFLCEPDNGPEPCDLWAQDCPRGEKCMPWANDRGNSWNATRCSPIDPDPREPGESCTVDGSGVSGIDDCALHSMCWDVDPETNMGTCVALCSGGPFNPICSDPQTQCQIWNEGALILCLPECDPLAQNCSEGYVCRTDGDAFVCTPYVQSKAGAGAPCTYWNECDQGLFCAEASTVPQCAAETCCSSFCDLDAIDPDDDCALDGQICVPWYDPYAAPPGLAHVGACALP